MQKKILLLIVITSVYLTSCDDLTVENDLSYEEKMVVRSVVSAGKPIELFLARTTPPNSAYDTASSYINNAVVIVSSPTISDTLKYQGAGKYVSSRMNARNGEEYTMNILSGEKRAVAETQVPFTTTFQAGRLLTRIEANGDTSYYIEGVLTPRPGAVYGVTWSIIDGLTSTVIEDTVLNQLNREQDKTLLGHLVVRTRTLPPALVKQYRNSLFIRVHAFDEKFYKFFITQDANNASTNIFSQSGTALRWNVSGDAIGMFVGKSDFTVRIP